MNLFKYLLFAGIFSIVAPLSAQWTEVEWAETDHFSLIDFVEEEIGYAFMHELQGFNSTLEKTEDGGQTWTVVNLPFPAYDITDISFFEEGKGVFVFRDWSDEETVTKIYLTLDDGESWEEISPEQTPAGSGIAKAQFLNAEIGFLVVDQHFYKTTDGGDNWSVTEVAGYVSSLNFVDENTGTIGIWDGTFLYMGGMISTTDGGDSWNEITLDINNSVISKVKQFDATTAYAAPAGWGASNQFHFYKTTNNGADWTTVDVPSTDDNASLTGFDFLTADYGVVTLASNSQFYIFKTENGGDSWEEQHQSEPFYMGEIQLIQETGYVVGNSGTILRLNAPLGIENFNAENIPVYPNPAKSGQAIGWDHIVQYTEIQAYDLAGKLVFQSSLNAQVVNVPILKPGLYFLVLSNEQAATSVAKLILE